MKKALIIVFTKNGTPGQVKTRLAESIGEDQALNVFNVLLYHTKSVMQSVLDEQLADVEIHLTTSDNDPKWEGFNQQLQVEGDLGLRMKTAFQNGFDRGYQPILGIGSDLPELELDHIWNALAALENSDLVLGPAKDGGYYLIGMNSLKEQLFQDIEWSTDKVLQETIDRSKDLRIILLKEENDIDSLEDLLNSKGIQKMYSELLNLINNKHPY